MKVAMLISGQPRCVEGAFPNIRDQLIAPNNPDIFIHTWGDPNDAGLRSQITRLYNPISLVIEPPKSITNSHMNLDRMMVSHGRSYTRPNFVTMVYSMWYSMLQSNILKEVHRLHHDIHYDAVIRARFDLTYSIPINVASYDCNKVNISNRELPPEMIDDMFAFGSNELMNLYCGGFNWIEYIFSKRDKLDGIFCGETILYEMLGMLNISHNVIGTLNVRKYGYR